MANETYITVVGNLTADADLRFTSNGVAVANFTIASTPRRFNRQANEFKDEETLFVRCSAWRELAENAAESLTKGTRVIAHGWLKSRSFQDKEGNNRNAWELEVEEVGPSLRFATAQVTRQGGNRQAGGFGGGAPAPQGGGFGGGQPPQAGGWGANPGGGQPQPDPWGGQPSTGGWDTPNNDEPPF